MTIKKIMIVLIMLVSGMGMIKAQDRFSIGPRVGVNFANVSNVEGSKSVTGLALGLTSTYSISETSGITLEALYSSEGFKNEGVESTIHYLQIPLYYDFFFGKLGERFRPKVYVGLVPGFFLNAKSNDIETDKNTFNKFVLAASGGLGFNYRIGSRIWLNTDLRSYLGLSDLRAKDFSQGDKIASRNVQLSLGLAYGISKLD